MNLKLTPIYYNLVEAPEIVLKRDEFFTTKPRLSLQFVRELEDGVLLSGLWNFLSTPLSSGQDEWHLRSSIKYFQRADQILHSHD